MSTLGFGQPVGGVLQYAYTVPDLTSAMETWTSRLGIGPWFVRGPFSPSTARYRNNPAHFTLSLARAFSGHVMVELIQQHDEYPSIYREFITQRGYGFHHFGVGVHDFDAELARYNADGYEVAFSDTVPNGGRIAYMDTSTDLPGMVELIEMTSAQGQVYTAIYRACLDWDGSEPVRPE